MDPLYKMFAKKPIKFSIALVLLVGMLTALVSLTAAIGTILEVGKFSDATPGDDLPPGWEPYVFKKIKRHTDYRLVSDNGTVVLKAASNAAASGLIRRIRIDPKKYPIVCWRWKITKIYRNADVAKKEGDDAPARLHIVFKSDPSTLNFVEKVKRKAARLLFGEYPPDASISYTRASTKSAATIVSNPYAARSKMIVIESGKRRLNRWVQETRNVYEDYRNIFGNEPPMISGVGIMTDTDNTGEFAVSFYGDIYFKTK